MVLYLLFMVSPVLVYALATLSPAKTPEQAAKREKTFFVLYFIVMTLMIGLRHPANGSRDTQYYCDNWDMLRQIDFEHLWDYIKLVDLEAGYEITVWVLCRIFKSSQMLLVLTGAFFSLSLCAFVKRNCKNYVLAFLAFNCLGLFGFMVQGLRQAIAMSICLWGVEHLKKEHWIRFILTVGLACLFHASAVVFFVLIIVKKMKINVKSMAFFSVCVAIGWSIIPKMFDLMNSFMNDDYAIGKLEEEGGIVAILIYVVIILFGLIFRDKKDEIHGMFIYMALVGAIALAMRISVSSIITRISFYFAFAQMVVLSNSISEIKDTNTRTIVSFLAAFLCFGVAAYKATYTSLIPYNFFWQI